MEISKSLNKGPRWSAVTKGRLFSKREFRTLSSTFATFLSWVFMEEEIWKDSVDYFFWDLRFDLCESRLQFKLTSARPWCSEERVKPHKDIYKCHLYQLWQDSKTPNSENISFCMYLFQWNFFCSSFCWLFPYQYHFVRLHLFNCSAQHMHDSSQFWNYSNEKL